VFGDTGLITSNRMTQSVLLLSGLGFLICGLLRNWFLRLVVACYVVLTPDISYFLGMPKPEPQLLFFLGISIYLFRRTKHSSLALFFLGCSMGSKISALPIVFILLFYMLLKTKKEKRLKTLMFFTFGLSFSVPILLPSVLLVLTLLTLIFQSQVRTKYAPRLLFVTLALVTVGYLKIGIQLNPIVYFKSTLFNTNHGSDLETNNFVTWVHFFLFEWFESRLFLLFLPLLIVLTLTTLIGLKKAHIELDEELRFILTIIFGGLALNLVIFATAQRIWSYYLYIGFVITIVGIAGLIEKFFHVFPKRKLLVDVSYFLLFVVTTSVFVPQIQVLRVDLNTLIARDIDRDHVQRTQDYEMFLSVVSEMRQQSSRDILVSYDPTLYTPNVMVGVRLEPIWGPWLWEYKPDILYLGADLLPDSLEKHRFQKNFAEYNRAESNYRMNVLGQSNDCPTKECYLEYRDLSSGGKILIKLGK
jgi:hypothetical protein